MNEPIHLKYFQQQAAAWRDTVADYENELAHLQGDIAAAKANLAAYEHLISLHDGQICTVAELNQCCCEVNAP